MRKTLLLFLLLGLSASACVQNPMAPSPTSLPTALPTREAQPSRTSTPDPAATLDAERFKATIQAYQTQTASIKATERAAEDLPQVIGPENAGDLVFTNSLELEQIYSTQFSPDGEIAALLTDTGTRLIELDTLSFLAAIDSDVLGRLAFSPAGEGFAAGLPDGGLLIWPKNQAEVIEVPAHSEAITSLAYSPEGSALVTSSFDGTVKIWEVQTGSPLHEIQTETLFGPGLLPQQVWFSQDGTQAAVYLAGNSTIWLGSAASLLSGSPEGALVSWLDHAGPIADVRIDPAWQTLAWISRGTLQLMSIDGEEIGDEINHDDWILQSAYLPAGHALLVSTNRFVDGAAAGVVYSYDLATGELLHEMPGPYPSAVFSISPDHQRLVAGFNDGSMQLWNPVSAEWIADLAPPPTDVNTQVQSIAFTPDSSLFAVIDGSTGLMRLWASSDGALLGEVQTSGQTGWIQFNASGTRLVLITDIGNIYVFSVQ